MGGIIFSYENLFNQKYPTKNISNDVQHKIIGEYLLLIRIKKHIQ